MPGKEEMKLSEQLRRDDESGDFGKALAGYAERAAEMEDALDFYAKEENWGLNLGGECTGDACDRGERARRALGRGTDYSKFKDED